MTDVLAPAAVSRRRTRSRARPGDGRSTLKSLAASERLTITALWLLVAWGVLTFGGVYRWAYTPLLGGATLLGIYGLAAATPAERRAAFPLACILTAAVVVIALQLVPLPSYAIAEISPATDALLKEIDLVYAVATQTGESVRHPLSISPTHTLRALVFAVTLGLFTVGATAMLPSISTRRLIQSLVPLGVGIAVLGIVQKATFNGKIYWFWTPLSDTANAFGPFVTRNHFAGWMLMLSIVAAGHLAGQLAANAPPHLQTWKQRAAWFSSDRAAALVFTAFAVLIMSIAIVWSLSRSGILALGVGLLLLAGRASARMNRAKGALLAATLLAVIAAALTWRGLDRVAEWYGRTNTLEWRIEVWRQSLPILRDFPWIGTGVNTYGMATRLYLPNDPAWHVREAHNDYLQILTEGGIVLGVIVACGIVVIAVCVRRRMSEPQSHSTYWIRTGAVMALCAIAVQEIVDFSLQLPGNALLFCLLLAIALHRARPPRRDDPSAVPAIS